MIDVTALRQDTPGCEEAAHFNSAGSSLMPRPVADAIKQHLDLELQHDGYRAADIAADSISDAYAAYAELLGTTPRNIAIMENATDAWARAVSALRLGPGDIVLISENDYISNQIAFLSLAKRHQVNLQRLPESPDGGFCPDRADDLIRKLRPKLVAVTHVPTNSGLVQPVAEIAAACQAVDAYYLIDACQSIGQIPLDVAALGCDFLSASARKFLRGPRGSGVLYVADRVLENELEPLFVDMRGARWNEADEYTSRKSAQRFETWEYAYALVIGAAHAVRYALRLEVPEIAAVIASTAANMRRALDDIDGVRVLDRGRDKCGIVTLDIAGLEHKQVQPVLDRHKVTATLSYREYAPIDFDAKEASWALRVAPHTYTNVDDLDTLYAAVRELRGLV